MPFLATGVEHTSAPLAVRERVALDAGRIATLLRDHPAVEEAAVLATCNRLEVYMHAGDPEAALAAAHGALGVDEDIRPYVRRWDDLDAVAHLFRVASGLESQVLGEPQILAQVRETLEDGQRGGTVGTGLHALFRAAIRCARRVRSETALGRTDRSIGAEAVRVADGEANGIEGRAVLLIGGGEVARLAARELLARSPAALYVANRTLAVAADVAEQFGGTAMRIADVPSVLPSVDVVISATASPEHVLSAADIAARERPLLILDLAIPRDIDPAAGAVPNVRLRDLDSLLPGGAEGQWQDDIQAAEAIIAAEVQDFTAWILTRRVVPVIAGLRAHVEAVSEAEKRRVAARLAGLTDEERDAVESLTQRLIDKMFHHLVTRLRLAAQTDPKLVEAAEFFFLHGEGGLFESLADETAPATEQTQ